MSAPSGNLSGRTLTCRRAAPGVWSAASTTPPTCGRSSSWPPSGSSLRTHWQRCHSFSCSPFSLTSGVLTGRWYLWVISLSQGQRGYYSGRTALLVNPRILIVVLTIFSQIWNFDAKLAVNDSVLSKVPQLKLFLTWNYKLFDLKTLRPP